MRSPGEGCLRGATFFKSRDCWNDPAANSFPRAKGMLSWYSGAANRLSKRPGKPGRPSEDRRCETSWSQARALWSLRSQSFGYYSSGRDCRFISRSGPYAEKRSIRFGLMTACFITEKLNIMDRLSSRSRLDPRPANVRRSAGWVTGRVPSGGVGGTVAKPLATRALK